MEVIERANDAATLMRMLLYSMKLPGRCSHIQFVETFAKLQKESQEYTLELQKLLRDADTKSPNGVEKEDLEHVS